MLDSTTLSLASSRSKWNVWSDETDCERFLVIVSVDVSDESIPIDAVAVTGPKPSEPFRVAVSERLPLVTAAGSSLIVLEKVIEPVLLIAFVPDDQSTSAGVVPELM